MLKRTQRVHREDFEILMKQGVFARFSCGSIRAVKGVGDSRFSIVVPSKIAPKAVTRSRVRRIWRQTIQNLYPTLPKGVVGAIFIQKITPIPKPNEREKDIYSAILKTSTLLSDKA